MNAYLEKVIEDGVKIEKEFYDKVVKEAYKNG